MRQYRLPLHSLGVVLFNQIRPFPPPKLCQNRLTSRKSMSTIFWLQTVGESHLYDCRCADLRGPNLAHIEPLVLLALGATRYFSFSWPVNCRLVSGVLYRFHPQLQFQGNHVQQPAHSLINSSCRYFMPKILPAIFQSYRSLQFKLHLICIS